MIHGFMARRLMQRNLLRYLRSKGLSDVTMYGHLHSVDSISDELQASRREGRKLVILGYSQGGFHAVKVARELERRGVEIALLVSIAAGGLGRVFPDGGGLILVTYRQMLMCALISSRRETCSGATKVTK